MTATAAGTSKSQLVSELAKQQNTKFARFREDAETSDVKTFFFLFLNLNMARGNSTQGEFAYIWRSKWVGIIVMKVAGFILEIDQWGSNRLPSVILGGPFSRKGVLERGSLKRYLNLLLQTVPCENERLLKLSFTDLQVLNIKLKRL